MTTTDDSITALAQSVAAALQLRRLRRVWTPLPHQVPPPGDWYGWLLLAGRGAGKTDACARYVVDHVKGPPCLPGSTPHWIGIIAPTLGDAATSCFAGPSGIAVHDDSARMVQEAGGLVVRWPNGAKAKLFGAGTPEDVERLRSGGNRCLAWLEELAAWRHLDACWAHMRFGLRTGPHPRWVGSTTPKPRMLIKKLANDEVARVVLAHATTNDNPFLPEDLKAELYDTYGGTTLGAQELEGRIVEQDENALWRRENIERDRVRPDDVPKLVRVTVGVDPSGGAGEQGIVVTGKFMQDVIGWKGDDLRTMEYADGQLRHRKVGHLYTLADYTVHTSPDGWGRRAVQAAVDFEADDIVVEVNYGGDMAVATINAAADAMGVPIPVRTVRASRGKRVRAEPVSALSAQEKDHHVGVFEELEDQLCTWTPEMDYSPDRLDAKVWGPWHMKLVSTTAPGRGSFGGVSMARSLVVNERRR